MVATMQAFGSSAAIKSGMLGCVALVLALLNIAPARADDEGPAAAWENACNDALGYTGCANMMHPGPRTPPPPPKPDVWGALAVSPSTMASGNSWNYNDEASASARALAECRASSRAADCKVVVTVADVCVALAKSMAAKIYTVGGPIGAAKFAENNALLKCQRAGGHACAIAVSFCADGINHVLAGQTVYSNGNPIFVSPGQSNAALGRR